MSPRCSCRLCRSDLLQPVLQGATFQVTLGGEMNPLLDVASYRCPNGHLFMTVQNDEHGGEVLRQKNHEGQELPAPALALRLSGVSRLKAPVGSELLKRKWRIALEHPCRRRCTSAVILCWQRSGANSGWWVHSGPESVLASR
jgi:hypothetical protein